MSEQTKADGLARRMATQACMKAGFADHAPVLLPFAALLVECEEALERANHCHCTDTQNRCEDDDFVDATLTKLRKLLKEARAVIAALDVEGMSKRLEEAHLEGVVWAITRIVHQIEDTEGLTGGDINVKLALEKRESALRSQLRAVEEERDRVQESYRLLAEQELAPAKEAACDWEERAIKAEAEIDRLQARLAESERDRFAAYAAIGCGRSREQVCKGEEEVGPDGVCWEHHAWRLERHRDEFKEAFEFVRAQTCDVRANVLMRKLEEI